MREILFKAKRLSDGAWVEGFPYWGEYSGAFILQNKTYSRRNARTGEISMGDNIVPIDVDPSTVCEYTGQVDYESEEPIFCDDLLKSQSGKERIYVVGFEDGGYFARERGETGIGMPLTIENIGWSMLKRIGSIHDGEGGQ